jgi:hypothetical protein
MNKVTVDTSKPLLHLTCTPFLVIGSIISHYRVFKIKKMGPEGNFPLAILKGAVPMMLLFVT